MKQRIFLPQGKGSVVIVERQGAKIMSFTMGPECRVRSKKDFERIHARGRYFQGRRIRVWVLQEAITASGAVSKPRMGVIVSRKAELRATRRNRWKRRIREAFRRNQARIHSGVAILVQARPKALLPTYTMIEEEMIGLLERAEALRSAP